MDGENGWSYEELEEGEEEKKLFRNTLVTSNVSH